MGPQKKGFPLDTCECKTLRKIASRFIDFTVNYTPFFQVYRRNVGEHARNYLAGLLTKAPRKNMERISEAIDGGNYADYQHFISDSGWDQEALKKQVALEVNELLGSSEAVFCIDESGFTKKGKKSVGVSRQYNGRLGKIDNCQVGVFASLCDGKTRSSIVDYRLYLPEEWVNDTKRCKQAGIPAELIVKKTKLDHAYDMLVSAITNGLEFDWVAADSFYGRDLSLLNKIDDTGKNFTVDVPENFSVYQDDPRPYVPRRTNGKGRKFTTRRSRTDSITVAEIFNTQDTDDWEKVHVRETTKGQLNLRAYRKRVYTWNNEEKQARQWWLVFTYDPKTKERKYIVSNADEVVSLDTIVCKHGCRFWIERTFQDGKTSAGMGDYQVRGWLGWHHHMAMVMMALLFMLQEREYNKKDVSLLSCQDIVELLTYYIPRKDRSEEDVFRNLLTRHKQRRESIESAKRRQQIHESILPK